MAACSTVTSIPSGPCYSPALAGVMFAGILGLLVILGLLTWWERSRR